MGSVIVTWLKVALDPQSREVFQSSRIVPVQTGQPGFICLYSVPHGAYCGRAEKKKRHGLHLYRDRTVPITRDL